MVRADRRRCALIDALMEIDPQFPKVTKQQRETLAEVKSTLEAQAPRGTAPDPFEQDLRQEKAKKAEKSARRDGKPMEPAAPGGAGDGGGAQPVQ